MNKKYTKRALFASVIVLILCCAMLVGTTMAWFTDTASTNVTNIQAGTLDVDLVGEDGATLSGKTLDFVKAEGGKGETVLWEPGCTYTLPAIKVVNNGTLALKYKLEISGVKGSSKLLEVIDWTINDKAIEDVYADTLSAKTSSETLVIKGHMKDTAGNAYQGLTLDGIAISLVATQAAEEFDSIGNQYDAGAAFPEVIDLENLVHDKDILSLDNYTGIVKDGTINASCESYRYGGVVKGGDVTFNDVDILSTQGGVAATQGAKVVYNGGKVKASTASSGARYCFYLENAGSEVTINGGEFVLSATSKTRLAYIYASDGTTVYVNGGNFGKASTRDGYAGIMGDGTVIIKGGTFGFDPTKWVAPGYVATNNGSTWTVAAA